MQIEKKATCRRVRAWLQDVHDGEAPAGQARFARAAEAHLERCPRCRSFREFLCGYGQELGAALDGLVRQSTTASPRAPARRAPARRRIAWAVPAAAVALLAIAAGIQAPRLAAGARLERQVRAEMAALVEELYARPLAQGVENALAVRTVWEGLDQGDGLQGLGEGEGSAE
jgi:hypothetical protein